MSVLSNCRLPASPRPRRAAFAASLLVLASSFSSAFAYNEPPLPPIGTTTVATADLLVTRPATTPCIVPLLSNQEFADYNPVPIAYAPPAACPGPWAKVVMQADFSVTAGIQYDRTGTIAIGGVNVYFGTTMEPDPSNARAWHVERDVTDYTATLMQPQAGQALLGNTVNSTYNGIIFGTASLAFYPVAPNAPLTPSAQWVMPLAASTDDLSPTNPTLNATFTFPTNVEKLYLDVIAQSQNNDEFWYTCVPDEYATVLQSCGGTAFREVEVAIDGSPAGAAPIFPWIYTGGISPNLWFPTPGVQTLNFMPYRVDLTPFAGVLDDGKPHTIGVQVFDAQDHFSVTGTLMAWLDAGSTQVTGAVTARNLTLPTVKVNASGLKIDGSNAKGPLLVSSSRKFTITGNVNTSHGPVSTSVDQTFTFGNTQNFNISAAKYVQSISQQTNVLGTTTTTDATGTSTKSVTLQYPLSVAINVYVAKGIETFQTGISQTLSQVLTDTDVSGNVRTTNFTDSVTPNDKVTYFPNGNATLDSMTSAQHYMMKQTGQGCYNRTIAVALNAVSAVTDGCKR